MTKRKPDLPQGTLDMLVLKALSLGPMHGFGIGQRIRQLAEDMLTVEEGTLYPALYRMSRKGWISGKWGASENNRRAKYYHLTNEGRRQFLEQTSGWQRFASAVNQAVTTTKAPQWAS